MNFSRFGRIVVCDPERWQVSRDGHLGLTGFCHLNGQEEVLSVDQLLDLLRRNLDEVSQLRGEFAIWYVLGPEVTLIRDPVGVAPLYYAVGSSVFVASSRMAMRRMVKSKPNPDFFENIKNHDFSDLASTSDSEIWRAPPGRITKISSQSIHSSRYWEIAKPKRVSLRQAIEASVNLRMRVSGKTGLLLSGGFDSSLLAAQMENLNRKAIGLGALSFSMVFGKPPEDERESLLALIAKVGIQSQLIEEDSIDSSQFWLNSEDIAMGIYYDPTLTLFRPLLNQAAASGCGLVFSGLGGDDLFSNQLSIGQILAGVLPERWFKQAVGFAPGHKRAALSAINRLARSPVHAAMLERFVFSGGYAFSMEQEQELANSMGLRMSYPLLDTRVIELAATSFDIQLLTGFSSKRVLRQAARGLLADDLRWRVSQQGYDSWRFKILKQQFDEPRSILNWIVAKNRLEFPKQASDVNQFLLRLYGATMKEAMHIRETTTYGEPTL